MVKKLEKQGLVEIVPIGIGRGAPKILYQKPGSVPGIRHEFYVHWICGRLAYRGLECVKNKTGPDIVVPELNMAIEVELGKSNIRGNINQDVQKFDQVIVCFDDEKLIQRLSLQNKSEKVSFLAVQNVPDFIDLLQDEND